MLRRPQRLTPLALAAALAATLACGGSDKKSSCDVAKQTGCASGQVCEVLEGGTSLCTQPLVIRGNVFDLGTAAGIESARVVALDANRSPISTVAITDAAGDFSIQVANARSKDGKPVARDVFLRADAAGYATFPSGIREALPVNTAAAALVDGRYELADPQTTDVGLLELPSAGTGTISGTAAVPANQPGVLVVAEPAAGGPGSSALADRNGDYAIFNLAPGDYTVQAYARGAVHAPRTATVAADAVTDVDLSLVSGAAGAKVTGQVSLVNRGAGTGTSVVLVVESTFDPALLRGETPPGLRAPGPSTAPNLDGAFEIAGVPPGRYVALAAFENDFLVRDPDVCQGGTELVHFDVTGAQPVSLETFKITGSLDVISPGADGPELLTTASPIIFSWVDDSSETAYEITVVDAFGNEVLPPTRIPGVSGGTPTFTYPGTLAPGYYQFKVKSVKGLCTPPGASSPVTQYISQTEDLKGVFIVP
ncbi:carboxypeptidase-like regulatory domain-containing protein [Anaeromyxobacter sp. SG17]|uniref:carboxypeptidase-like regulatory domain-containing protein n=1 Tax=Anaeromyxobacter sp. SG17 TaxID=2925405 RepID=UPI001F58AA37|nr:carboxypeptidase-like regulatory domain-containing protein [Anaeromyxobacter sp. SG17]